MKKQVFLLALLVQFSALGQEIKETEPRERNTIYAEAFGQGFCWSLNYDRLLNVDKRVKTSFSIGAVYVPEAMKFGDGTYYGIPVSYNWLFGKKSHHLELGIGVTSMLVLSYWQPSEVTYYNYLTPKIGYRYQRPQGGLFFKATATPMVDLFNVSRSSHGDVKFINFSSMNNVVGLGYAAFPWPGASIGYTFK